MMNLLVDLVCALSGAYIVGSLPVGYWIAQWAGIHDIRRYGSGNTGATNVARLLGLHYFFIVFFLDACKAYLYVNCCISYGLSSVEVMLIAYALLIGNAFSLFLQGTGGKGMATMAGIMYAINPLLCTVLFITWLAGLYYTRVVGMASIFTVVMLPVYALFFTTMQSAVFMLSVALWIAWRHQDNFRMYSVGRP